jgi:hypothetical protein
VSFSLERTPLGPNEALLVLSTDPPDARVQLDTETLEGTSPFEVRLAARSYRLRVTHDGRRMHESELRLPGGERTERRVELDRERASSGGSSGQTTQPQGGSSSQAPAPSGPGAITINATPWCNVSIDGQSVGETPIVNRSIASGRHTITCTNPELGVTRTRTAEVRPGETARVRIDLQE